MRLRHMFLQIQYRALAVDKMKIVNVNVNYVHFTVHHIFNSLLGFLEMW